MLLMMKRIIPYLFAGMFLLSNCSIYRNINSKKGGLEKVVVLEKEEIEGLDNQKVRALEKAESTIECLQLDTEEKVETVAKKSILKKYASENIVHVDYNELDFDNYNLVPLDENIENKLIDFHLKFENKSIMIPDSVMLKWKNNYLNLKDSTFSEYYLDLESMFYDKELDSTAFNEFNLSLLERLTKNIGLNKDVKDLSIKESLDLVFLTTRDMLEFRVVDIGKFKVEGISYNDLPFDEKIETGFGDCNIYSSLAGHLFRNLKKVNSKLENVSIGDMSFGRLNNHDWTQIYFTDGEKTYISSVDLSVESEDYETSISNFYYFSKCKAENLLPFYHDAANSEGWDDWKKLFHDSYKEAEEYNSEKYGADSNFGRADEIFFSKFIKWGLPKL